MNDIEKVFEKWWVSKNGNEPEYGDHLHLTEDGFGRLHYQYVHSMGEAREAWKQARIETLEDVKRDMSIRSDVRGGSQTQRWIDTELEKLRSE